MSSPTRPLGSQLAELECILKRIEQFPSEMISEQRGRRERRPPEQVPASAFLRLATDSCWAARRCTPERSCTSC